MPLLFDDMNIEEKQILMWFAAVAVLRCPMTVTDKIQTLEGILLPLVGEYGLPTIPPTGLEPFDAAISNYFGVLTNDQSNS